MNIDQIWQDYTQGKQTYQQLAVQNKCAAKTIQRKRKGVKIVLQNTFPSHANVLMDTTYFGHKLGVMVFKDATSKTFLFKQIVKHEITSLYVAGIADICRRG